MDMSQEGKEQQRVVDDEDAKGDDEFEGSSNN